MDTPPRRQKNLPAADGIRGLACLLVLLVHAASFFWPASFPWLRGGGKYGVWLFFVLSAFLLTLRLQQRGMGAASLIDYALGRSLRILPLYVLACLIYYWAGIGISTNAELHAAVTFQEGFIHLWTVPVEFKFYLLLPPLGWGSVWLQRHHGNFALLSASLVLLVLQQWLWPYWLTPGNSPHTRWYLPAFIFGILAALLLPHARQLPRARLATPAALMTLLVLLLALPGSRLWLFGTPLAVDLADKHLFLGLLWAIFLALLVDGDGLAGRLLRNRVLSSLGAISYSTYLFHWLIFSELASHWPGSLPALVLALLLAMFAGTAGFHLVERPLERLRRRLMNRSRTYERSHP